MRYQNDNEKEKCQNLIYDARKEREEKYIIQPTQRLWYYQKKNYCYMHESNVNKLM